MEIPGPSDLRVPTTWLTRAVHDDALSSSLVLLQTSRHRQTRHAMERRQFHRMMPPLITPRSKTSLERKSDRKIEVEFRHAGTLSHRKKIADALAKKRRNKRRVDRFNNCGADAVVMAATDGTGFKIFATYCGDRLCERCNKSRAWHIAKNVEQFLDRRIVRFVTLTRKTTDETLSQAIKDFRHSFQRLIRTDMWTAAIESCIWFLEVTRGATGRHWHVHLHGLCTGTWIDQRALSRAWEKSSGGSRIVHVELVSGRDQAVAYTTDYAAEIIDKKVANNPKFLREAAAALKSIRLCGTTGKARGLVLTKRERDTRKFRRIGALAKVVRDAASCQPYALAFAVAARRSIQPGNDGNIYIDRYVRN